MRDIRNRQSLRRPQPRVLVVIEAFSSYGRGLLRGIKQYEREHGPWSIFSELRKFSGVSPHWLKKNPCDGILARSTTREMEETFLKSDIPFVELLGTELESKTLKVHCDNLNDGKIAAEHYLNSGFHHFGFFAFGAPWWVSLLRDGFLQSVPAHCTTSSLICSPRSTRLRPLWNPVHERKVVAWLRSLPKPVGIFAAPVDAALLILKLCRDYAIAVPDEVAVLTDDDDDCICNLSSPPLSAIQGASFLIGYEAARNLDLALHTGHPLAGTRWIPSSGMVVRTSTDTIAVHNSELVQAIRFIRNNYESPITVNDVCEEVCLSRRTVERLFREELNESPHDEIVRCRVRKIAELLSETNLTAAQIAWRVGFQPNKYFFSFFQEHFGCTPLQYRKKMGHDAPLIHPK